MTKKKIYIAGSGGMLGEAFYHQFKGSGVFATNKFILDNIGAN